MIIDIKNIVFDTALPYTCAKQIDLAIKERRISWDDDVIHHQNSSTIRATLKFRKLIPEAGEHLDANPGWAAYAYVLAQLTPEQQTLLFGIAKAAVPLKDFRKEAYELREKDQPKVVVAVTMAYIDRETWCFDGTGTFFIRENDPRAKMTNEELEKEFERCEDGEELRTKVVGIRRC